MRVTFLGTGAGESYPGYWCECANCTYARMHGGRNVRGNSAILIDDDILIDLNAHSFEMFTRLNISPAGIRHLLVTHPHIDHFDPAKLLQRNARPDFRQMQPDELTRYISPCFTNLPFLQIHGNTYVKEALMHVPGLMERAEQNRIAYRPITEGLVETCDTFSFIPLRSQHGPRSGFAHSYIVERNGKRILYASDTGGYDADMLSILLSYTYDCIIMEGTFGLGAEDASHMSLTKNRRVLRLLSDHHVWKGTPCFYLTHICPHWAPPHDLYAPMVEKEGMLLAYDGKIIEI